MSNFPANWPDIAWDKLTLSQRQRAVDILHRAPDWDGFAPMAREGYDQHGSDFIHQPPLTESVAVPSPDGEDFELRMPWHMGGGMAVRNHLRHHGFTDEQLPTLPEVYGEPVSTWDDFYVQAVEAAIGVRPLHYIYDFGVRQPVYAEPPKPSWTRRLRSWLARVRA